MTRAAIIGDGPAGLSAALFLAKNGLDTHVFGQDGTAMHHAHLFNYLGVDDIDGSEFQHRALAQVAGHGATFHDTEVTAITASDDGGFELQTDDAALDADYVVLAGGKPSQRLAVALGAMDEGGRLAVDAEQRTKIDGVYAVGRLVRPERSQAIISAGAGAIAAIDILSREAGKDITDWDTPDDD